MTKEAELLRKLRAKGWRFEVKRSRKFFGLCHHDKKLIRINPVGHIVSTIVHELIHVEEPKLHETIVVALEQLRRKEMSISMENEILLAFSPDLLRMVDELHAIRGGL